MAEIRKQRPWLWVEAVCSRCANTSLGRHVRANHIGTRAATKAVEKDAIAAGWTPSREGDWACPSCAPSPEGGSAAAHTEPRG